jgi:hypothetical protein
LKIVRSRRVVMAAFLALALPLTLAACGSDDGGDTTAQEDTSTEETPAESPSESPSEAAAEGELVHVTAEEYKFNGIPETLEAGSYAFHFENVGEEEHELAMAQIKTDVSVDELLKMDEKEQMKQIAIVGGTFAKPGETAKEPFEADLEAGRYVAVCFVPTKKGVPHAFEGMVHEFTVE